MNGNFFAFNIRRTVTGLTLSLVANSRGVSNAFDARA
jgi:hypothetical protein